MARKRKTSRIGFDPLAWMHEEGAPAAPQTPPARSPRAGTRAGRARRKAGGSPKQDAVARDGDGSEAVNLGGALNIEHARDLYGALKEALQRGGERVVLDAAAVREVDTAGLQLLGAFVREATGRGISVDWRDPQEAIYRGSRLLGLQAALRLPASE